MWGFDVFVDVAATYLCTRLVNLRISGRRERATHRAVVAVDEFRVLDLVHIADCRVKPSIALPDLDPDGLGTLCEEEGSKEARGAGDCEQRAGSEV